MKIIAVLCMVILVSGLTPYAFTQSEEKKIQSYAQVVVRNANGQLVTYLELQDFTILDEKLFSQYVNQEISRGDFKTINQDRKALHVIKKISSLVFENSNVISSSIMADQKNSVILPYGYFSHEGFPVSKGDKITTVWTILSEI